MSSSLQSKERSVLQEHPSAERQKSWQKSWQNSWRKHNRPTLDSLGLFYILLSATGFGTAGVLAKLAYAHGLNPLSTQIWKLGGGALVLWGWLIIQAIWNRARQILNANLSPADASLLRQDIRQNIRQDRQTVKNGGWKYQAIAPFLLGAIGYAAFSMSLFGAFSHATVGVTMLLFYTYPAFTAVLGWSITQKPLSRWQAMCLGLTVVGCAITVDWHHQTSSSWGLILGLSAAIGYAVYLLGSAKIVKASSPVVSAAWMLSGTTCTMVAIALWQKAWVLPPNGIAFSVAAGLATVSTAFPIVCLYAGLKRLDVVPVAILSTLEPVVAIALSVLCLAEPLWIGQILGGALILSAAIMLQSRTS